VLALHPRYVLDEHEGTLTELDELDESAILDDAPYLSLSEENESSERGELDIDVYADILLLIDPLEREDLTALDEVETPALVNLYTLLSYVQRNANDLRTDVADVLLDRIQHNRPRPVRVVQRTTRQNRSLKDEERSCEAHCWWRPSCLSEFSRPMNDVVKQADRSSCISVVQERNRPIALYQQSASQDRSPIFTVAVRAGSYVVRTAVRQRMLTLAS